MKKLLIVFICLLSAKFSFGQSRFSLPFSNHYDEEALIMIGIQYNYVHQNYQLHLKKDWQTHTIDYGTNNIHNIGTIQGITSASKAGFSVGIPIDMRVNDNLYFTANPSFLFMNNSGITYSSMDTTVGPLTRMTRHNMSSTEGTNFNVFEAPLSIKFRSDEKILKNKFNRYRGYMTAGFRYSRFIGIHDEYNALIKEKENSLVADRIIVKPDYMSWEFGLGVDIFFQYFKMSPEIRFSQSFNSILNHNHTLSQGNQFMAPLDKALVRNIYFSLIFQ